MRKGAGDQGAKKKKAKVGDSLRVNTSKTEDDNDAVDIGGSQPSKQSNSSVIDNYIDSLHKIVPTPSDLFFGVAPSKVEKGPSQGREKKFCGKGERTEDTLQIGPTGKSTQLSGTRRGFLKVSSNVQDPVLQVYKSKRGQTIPVEVEKKKTKTRGVCVQEKSIVRQNPPMGLLGATCDIPMSRRVRSRFKLMQEAKDAIIDTLDEVSKAIDDVLLKVQPISSPNASQLNDRVCEGGVQEVTLQDTISNMTPWDDRWVSTPELLLYQAQGNGALKPFAYHPEMETMFNARRNELLRQKAVYVAQGKQRLEEILSSRMPPSPPRPMSVPGLYYLREFDGEVTLSWSWDHQNGEIF